MARVLFTAAVVFATIYAFVDCLQTNGRLLRVLPKAVWLLVVLVPVLGPMLWFISGRTDSRGGQPPVGRGRRPSGPRGPDDDPEFLRRL
ncbi:phosphatidylserine synthase [Intrasporangium chromatireducens Q5-1]|uniref:Phosphatidylserine synthase n=1 Tax=Intrasporangium chromatireducens Q5-1 TaxID=584657 RepID=W9GJP1_9MICO|nr:PLDc N-terminal domain-containing protein [Intrasporangium chromatireducens]EWT05003.1 phosphatidylserine synthase [Intrasporangium chromatireducens Q5-1]